MQQRKILILLIAFFLILILGLGLYLIFGGRAEREENLPPPTQSLKRLERGGEQQKEMVDRQGRERREVPLPKKIERVRVLVSNPSLGLAIAPGGRLVYFDKIKGQFMEQPLEGGGAKPIIEASFTSDNVERVIWSPNKEAAILEFSSGEKFHIDLETGRSTNLHQLVAGISWSPDSQKIVYEFQNEEHNAKLTIANPDGSNPQVVKELGYTSRLLGWSPLPGGPIAFLQVYAIGEGRNVYPVYEDGSTGNMIKFAGFGAKAKYSRDGMRILYTVLDTDEFKQTLWVVDYNGLNQYSLGVQTFIEKCVWDAESINIYCAVPIEELGSEPDLEDDTTDSIWRINTRTAEKTEAFNQASSEIKLDAENLWLTQDEKKILLENRKDDRIYEVRIE